MAAGPLSPAFTSARNLYYQAVEGDAEALDKAARAWGAFETETPHDPIVEAYLGSTQVMQASKTLALWKKGKLTKDGLSKLDQAVAKAPANLEVRFLRAASTFHLPGFFSRREQCESDLKQIVPGLDNAVRAGQLEARLAAAALLFHGIGLERGGDTSGARVAWQHAIALAPESRSARDAAKRLGK